LKTTRELLQAVVSSTPRITMDAVQADGNVAFHVSLKDCSLTKEDCSAPVMGTAFFVNFMGEFLVRENIYKFAVILTGLDPGLCKKLVGNAQHSDFGMVTDKKWTTMTFQMHLSLVRNIVTEMFGDKDEGGGRSVAEMFDQSKPGSPYPGEPKEA